MSTVYASAILMTILAAIAYGVMSVLFSAPPELATGISGFFILCMGPCREFLERSAIERRARKQHRIVIPDMSQLMLSPFAGLLVGVMLIIASIQFSSGFAGASLAALDAATPSQSIPFSIDSVGILALPIQLVFTFYIARWSAINIKRRIFLVIISAIFVGRVLSSLLDYFIFSVIEIPHGLILPGPFQAIVVGGAYTLITAPAWGLGWLIGKKRREASYLTFLIKGLKPDQRQALASIALEEVVALRAIKK